MELKNMLSPEDLVEQLSSLVEQNQWLVLIFKGTPDSEGHNWCSDCVKAEPMINDTLIPLAEKKGVRVILCQVGDRDQWKNKEHVLRVNKMLKLTGVPTVLLIQNGKVTKRLEEEQCQERELIEEFMV